MNFDTNKGLDQQQPTYVCTLKSQTNLCYLVHERMQPFCLALNRKAGKKQLEYVLYQ